MDPDGNGDVESFLKKQVNLYNLQVAVDQIASGVASSVPHFYVSEALVKQFHSIAMTGLLNEAGLYRKVPVKLNGSPYIPPNYIEVPTLMASFCDYLRTEWENKDLLHLSAFTLWRLNWIHPFRNGNGRTARACSYLVLCAKHGKVLPPKQTVMEQMVANKAPHDALLRQADITYTATQDIDAAVKPLADFMSVLLANQLRAYFQR